MAYCVRTEIRSNINTRACIEYIIYCTELEYAYVYYTCV